MCNCVKWKVNIVSCVCMFVCQCYGYLKNNSIQYSLDELIDQIDYKFQLKIVPMKMETMWIIYNIIYIYLFIYGRKRFVITMICDF